MLTSHAHTCEMYVSTTFGGEDGEVQKQHARISELERASKLVARIEARQGRIEELLVRSRDCCTDKAT